MIQIIPAIDIIDGQCVRLTQGDYAQKTIYNPNPLEVAKAFEAIGITRLHLVDLDGAKKGEIANLNVLEAIATHTNLIIDFGGGIKTNAAIKSVFDAGAAFATIGSIAVKSPKMFDEWIMTYGAEKILLGADVKDENIAINGWLETTEINIYDFIKTNTDKGLINIFCTDISKDGLLQGPAITLYKNILEANPSINLIASGGVSNMLDVKELDSIGCQGVIIGKAIYEDKITFNDIKNHLKNAN